MKTTRVFSRLAVPLLCVGLILGLCGPMTNLVPNAEAALTGSKAKAAPDCNAIRAQIKKVKRQIKKAKKIRSAARKRAALKRLKKKLKKLKQQLARCLATPSSPFPIEMVTVGNPGNTDDPADGDQINAGVQNFGAVAADFKIGKYEVTNTQYAAFLNAVAKTDPNGLYSPDMGTDVRAGITRNGVSPNFSYTVKPNMSGKPVVYVSFWDACRFCNWLHNGMPTGSQLPATTEDGAYDLTDSSAVTNNTVARKVGALYFLPSEDQWYKAAYHDPRTQTLGGPTGDDNYWLYPTQSDSVPTAATVDAVGNINNDTANIANYNQGANWNGTTTGNGTTVGSGGPGSASFYGAFDMGGNVLEWNEEIVLSSSRGFRGGSWDYDESRLQSSFRDENVPGTEYEDFGFRVASP